MRKLIIVIGLALLSWSFLKTTPTKLSGGPAMAYSVPAETGLNFAEIDSLEDAKEEWDRRVPPIEFSSNEIDWTKSFEFEDSHSTNEQEISDSQLAIDLLIPEPVDIEQMEMSF